MALDLKPRLSGENSIIASLAVAGLVVGVYQAKVGPVSDVHATDVGDINLTAAVRKAGWEALAVTAAIALLAKDMNIVILGAGAVIFEEACYRHALATNPGTGQIDLAAPGAYTMMGGAQDGKQRFTLVTA